MMLSQVFAITIALAMIFLVSYIVLFIQNNFVANEDSLVDRINSCLPQTQCAQCGYPGCKPYALAISNNEADINRCAPGGQATIESLATLLNLPSKSLAEDLSPSLAIPRVAKINEAECIGCLLCIKACPVNAIVGANKLMHTVITDQCTGCDLCVAPCPMSCISMVEQPLPIKYSYK